MNRKLNQPPRTNAINAAFGAIKADAEERVKDLIAESERREREALRVYRPLPTQREFIASMASEKILRGGNRCLGAEQPIYDPVLDCERPVSEIDGPFHVLALDPQTGRPIVASASEPFIKGWGDLYEVTFSDGTTLVTTLEHRIVDASGQWTSIEVAYEAQSPLAFLPRDEARRAAAGDAARHCRSNRRARRSQIAAWSCTTQQARHLAASHTSNGRAGFQKPTRHASLYAELRHGYAPAVRHSESSNNLSREGVAVQRHQSEHDHATMLHECDAFLQRSTEGICQSIHAEDGRSSEKTVAGYPASCFGDRRLCGEQPPSAPDSDRSLAPLQGDALAHSQRDCGAGGLVSTPGRSRFYLSCARPSILGDGRPTEDRSGEPEFPPCATTSTRYSHCTHSDPQSHEQFGPRASTTRAAFEQSAFESWHPRGFRNANKLRTVTIAHLRYLRTDAIWDITVEPFANYWTGVFSANSGKSVTAACHYASLCLRQPIIGNDGNPIPLPPKKFPNQPLLAWCIGFDQTHIGQTLYRLLFEPGLFLIIKDDKTGQWRTYNPVSDDYRKDEARPAEPLIPPRLIKTKSWAWENRAENVFKSVTLKNGTKICAYPSTSLQAKQGDPVDIIWIDEDVRWAKHIGEWQARLSDRGGRMIWSAWPHSSNLALVKMSERAKEQAERDNPDVHETVLTYSANPFIDANEKRKRLEAWGPDESKARDLGEFQFDRVLMYNFMPRIHGIPNDDADDLLTKLYTSDKNFEFPMEWTRYLILDPGYSTCAVLFVVVPPPEKYGKRMIIEDELYLHQISADEVAREVANKIAGKVYEAFIIDYRGGRMTPMSGGPTVATQYAMAFEKHRIKCIQTGSTFMWGSDNVPAGTEKVREWMRVGEKGSIIRVVLDKTPNLQKEFKAYKRRITPGDDDPAAARDEPVKGYDHLMDTCRYAVMHGVPYVEPTGPRAYVPPKLKAFREFMAKHGQGSSESINLGPPILVTA